MFLAQKKILLALSGSIACYKAAELVRLLKKAKADVQVLMTPAATAFITPLTLQTLSQNPVLLEEDFLSQQVMAAEMLHIQRKLDLILIAPATANVMAKLSLGLADDLLSSLCLARDCPLFLAPAMNRQMWEAETLQDHLQQLKKSGIHILGPDTGEQACGEYGLGRFLPEKAIVQYLNHYFVPKSWQGKRVLITAGPTYEAIDAVRGLSNLSSGKMGFALARAAYACGANVRLIAGPCALETPLGIQRCNVTSAAEMEAAVLNAVDHVDVFIAAAAVSDWRVTSFNSTKTKKTAAPQWQWTTNPDILAKVAASPKPPFCIGFASECADVDLAHYAKQKRKEKNIPVIVANQVPAAFGSDENEVCIFDEKDEIRLPRMDKYSLALQLLQIISQRYLNSENS